MPKKFVFNNPPLTKKRFEALLTKAAQPVSEWNKPAQVETGKETVRPSGGRIGKYKRQGKTEGKEDSHDG